MWCVCRETGQPGSESHSAGLPILCAGGTVASRGGGEATTSIGGSSAAWSGARHAPTHTDAARRRRAHRDDSGRGHILHGFPHNVTRFQAARNGCVKGVAGDGRRGVHFNFLFGKTLRSSFQVVVVRNNLDCREFCAVVAVVEYQQAGGTHAVATRRGVRAPVTERSRGREKGELAWTPSQMTTNSRPICGRVAWMTCGTRCTLSEWKGLPVITWTVRPWTFL